MVYRLTVRCYYRTVGMSVLSVSSVLRNSLLSPGRGSILEMRQDSTRKRKLWYDRLKGNMFCWKTACPVMPKCWLVFWPVTSHGSFFFAFLPLSVSDMWKQEAGLRLLAVISLALLGPRLNTHRHRGSQQTSLQSQQVKRKLQVVLIRLWLLQWILWLMSPRSCHCWCFAFQMLLFMDSFFWW